MADATATAAPVVMPPSPLEQAEWEERITALAAAAEAMVGKPAMLQQRAELALQGFGLLWTAWSPELLLASCRASLHLGQCVIAGRPMGRQTQEAEDRIHELWQQAQGDAGGMAVTTAPPVMLKPPHLEAGVYDSPSPTEEEGRPGDGWLTAQQTAELLRIPVHRLQSLRKRGAFGVQGDGWQMGTSSRGTERVWLSPAVVERLMNEGSQAESDRNSSAKSKGSAHPTEAQEPAPAEQQQQPAPEEQEPEGIEQQQEPEPVADTQPPADAISAWPVDPWPPVEASSSEPTPEPTEPEPADPEPVVIEAQEPEPDAPIPEAGPPAPAADGWVKSGPVSTALGITRATLANWRPLMPEGSHWRPGEPGEGQGYWFHLPSVQQWMTDGCAPTRGGSRRKQRREMAEQVLAEVQAEATPTPEPAPFASDPPAAPAVEASSSAPAPESTAGNRAQVVALLEQLVHALKGAAV